MKSNRNNTELQHYIDNAIETLIKSGFNVDKAKFAGNRALLSTPRVAMNCCRSKREVDYHVKHFLSKEGFR